MSSMEVVEGSCEETMEMSDTLDKCDTVVKDNTLDNCSTVDKRNTLDKCDTVDKRNTLDRSNVLDKSNIKCVLVGDSMVGKTCLAKRLASHQVPSVYTPTMFDNYATTTSVDGKSFVLGLFDTAGQEEFDRLRTLAYVNSDVFLVCFSVMSPDSLMHVQEGWMPEIRCHAPHVPCVLVGTHVDLREELKPRGRKFSISSPSGHAHYVSTKEGEAASHRVGAHSYVECSPLTEAGILRLKEAAVHAMLSDESSESVHKEGCHCACSLM